ncbi:MAG: lipopolysaccharide biosynthesis protein [Methylovulum sp.]|nr:lipopolysaccharide biosynthesis protein [Methylovulum sp.]
MAEPKNETSALHAERRAFRFGRIRLAFFTSATSKGLGLLVQLLAVPFAIKALGAERFGVYTMLVSALVWIDLGRFGIGPGLTRGLVVAWNQDDRKTEQALFSSAFFLLTTTSIAIGGLFAMTFWLGALPLDVLFGTAAVQYRSEIEVGGFVVVLFFMAQIVFSAGEAARSAYQEDYVNNTMNGFGNLLAVGLVFSVATFWPTIQGFAIAIFGSLALSKGLNFGLLLGKSRSYLWPRWQRVNRHTLKPLLNSSLAFWVIQLATLMIQNFSLVQLGALTDPQAMVPFAVLFRFLQLLSTVVLMITMPLWPAITDAVVRKDHEWIRHSYWRLLRVVMIYSVGVAIAVGWAGQHLISLWVGAIHLEGELCIVLGIYFIIWMWNHSHTVVLFGLGRLWPMAFTLLGEGVAVLVLGWLLTPRLGILGMALSLCIAGLATSAGILPMLVRSRIEGTNEELQILLSSNDVTEREKHV